MKEELISFETAKLAKEKGFNVNYCETGCYNVDGEKMINKNIVSLIWKNYPAPTQSLLQKWLREKHDVIVLPEDECHPEIWVFNIKSKSINKHYCEISYKTYEEALEKGLQEALKLI